MITVTFVKFSWWRWREGCTPEKVTVSKGPEARWGMAHSESCVLATLGRQIDLGKKRKIKLWRFFQDRSGGWDFIPHGIGKSLKS